MQLKIQYLDNYDLTWGELCYKHADDSGFDVRAAVATEVVLKPGERALIPNGVRFELCPEDGETTAFEIQTRPRSGLAAKNGISVVNAPGTIDFGYRGELMTILINCGQEDFVVHPGDRIAQAVVCPIVRPALVRVAQVDEKTDRAEKGFGSSGKF